LGEDLHRLSGRAVVAIGHVPGIGRSGELVAVEQVRRFVAPSAGVDLYVDDELVVDVVRGKWRTRAPRSLRARGSIDLNHSRHVLRDLAGLPSGVRFNSL
jgi:hypothetical protein